MIQIFGTPKCKGTRAAQRFFTDRRIKVQVVDVREKGLSKGELASVARAVGGYRAMYDADGVQAAERGLRHADPSEERLAELLLADALLLRTPIVRSGTKAVIGQVEATWKQYAEAERP